MTDNCHFFARFVVALALMAASYGSIAQVNDQFWFEYMYNYPFANRYNLEASSTYSTLIQSPRWRSFDVQVTPEMAVNSYLDIMFSGTYSSTFQNESLTTSELRATLAARVHFTPNSRILTKTLIRFEQRNVRYIETDDIDRGTRTRIRLESLTPLNRSSMYMDNLWYLLADTEAFIVMDDDVQERYANRWRFRAGLGYRFSYSYRVEFVYTYQEAKNTLGDPFYAADNLFRVRLKMYGHKARPKNEDATGVGN